MLPSTTDEIAKRTTPAHSIPRGLSCLGLMTPATAHWPIVLITENKRGGKVVFVGF